MSADAEEAMGVASSGDVQFCVYNTVMRDLEDTLAVIEKFIAK
jgi:hypothetical protein